MFSWHSSLFLVQYIWNATLTPQIATAATL